MLKPLYVRALPCPAAGPTRRWNLHIDACLNDVAALLERELYSAVALEFERFPKAHAHFRCAAGGIACWMGCVEAHACTPMQGAMHGAACRIQRGPALTVCACGAPPCLLALLMYVHVTYNPFPTGRSQLLELYHEVLEEAGRQL
jgi:hypothetical protein